MPCPMSNWDAQRASARYEPAAPSWGVLCHQALTVERLHGFSRLAAHTPRAWRTPEEPRFTIGHDRPIPSGALRCASCSGAAAPLTSASWGRRPWGAPSYGSHHRATALTACAESLAYAPISRVVIIVGMYPTSRRLNRLSWLRGHVHGPSVIRSMLCTDRTEPGQPTAARTERHGKREAVWTW